MHKKNFVLLASLVFACFLALSAQAAYAANYTPLLVSPSPGQTDVAVDNSVFDWEVMDPADYYIIEWSRSSNFTGFDLIFSYVVNGYTFTVNGLPGFTPLFWRVLAVKGTSTYASDTGTFTTGNDNEPIVTEITKEYTFETAWEKDWKQSDSSYIQWTNDGSGYRCWFGTASTTKGANFYMYRMSCWGSGGSAYMDATIDIPLGGSTMSYEWAFNDQGYGDSLFIEYKLPGDTKYTTMYTHNDKSGNKFSTGWSYGSHPTSSVISKNEISLPTVCNGKSVGIRIRIQSNGWNYHCWLDNITFSRKSVQPKLWVFSDRGTPDYLGETTWIAGDRVIPTAPYIVAGETIERQYMCSGWIGTGSIPTTGTGNMVKVGGTDGFSIYRTSQLTWQWTVMYRILVNSTNGVGHPNPPTGYHLINTQVTLQTELLGNYVSADERLYFSNWSGSGTCTGSGTSNSVTFLVTSPGVLNWNYKTQFKFTIVSQYTGSGFTPPVGENWFFRNEIIKLECPNFVDTGGGVGAQYAGYTSSNNIPAGQNRPIFTPVNTAATFTWLWTPSYFLSIISQYGEIHGTQAGWYSPGTTITTSCDEYVSTANTRVRMHAFRYTAMGDISNGNGFAVPSFTLTQPTSIVFEWQKEFLCNFTTNAGTTTPPTGWFAENDVVSISSSAVNVPNETRYGFLRWEGAGQQAYSGTSLNATVTIREPIDQRAIWNIEHRLVVINVNGELNPDPSNWYVEGAPVTINAVSPVPATGTRFVPSWYGTGNGVLTIAASNSSPSSATLNIYGPIVQRIEWISQFSLIIENPQGYGFTYPPVGTYWLFDGDLATGYCSYADGAYVCTGFSGTGSIGNRASSYYSFEMTAPTTISWNWSDRPLPANEVWSGFSTVSSDTGGPIDIVRLPDGRLVIYAYSNAADSLLRAVMNAEQWVVSTIIENVGVLQGIDATVDRLGVVHLAFYRESPIGLSYFADNSFATAKSDFDATAIEDLGVLGIRSSVTASDGTVYISFFDMSDTSLKVAKKVEGGWEVTVVDNRDGAGFFNSIAIPAFSNLPVIAFARSGAAKGLYFAQFDGFTWTVTTIRDQFAGYFCSLALDTGGVPYIAYQSLDGPGSNSLHVASYADGVWSDTAVDRSGDTGYHISIAMDASGYLHVGYTDRNNLRYARQTRTGWETRTLVSGRCSGPTNMTFTNNVPAVVFLYDGKPAYIDATGQRIVIDDGSTPTPGGGGGGGGCFVATAAFGTMSSASVQSLTSIRDTNLASSSTGSMLVSLYYEVSPAAADRIRSCESLRTLLRSIVQ